MEFTGVYHKTSEQILFSRKYQDGILEKNGTLIRRKIKGGAEND